VSQRCQRAAGTKTSLSFSRSAASDAVTSTSKVALAELVCPAASISSTWTPSATKPNAPGAGTKRRPASSFLASDHLRVASALPAVSAEPSGSGPIQIARVSLGSPAPTSIANGIAVSCNPFAGLAVSVGWAMDQPSGSPERASLASASKAGAKPGSTSVTGILGYPVGSGWSAWRRMRSPRSTA
jgi:hypothetical protein